MTALFIASGLQPFLIERPGGYIFGLYHPPRGGVPPRGSVLCIPPFAEELNQTRRMSAWQAQALAEAGFGVLRIDLTGCGESSGGFADARWELWRDDVLAGLGWLSQNAASPISLWGIRLGGTLAAEIAHSAGIPIRHLVLWQPVSNGQTMLTQFLRIRVAAAVTTGREKEETTKSLRDALLQNEILEVAGYELHPALARAVDALRLDALVPPASVPATWFEIVPESGRPAPPGSQRVIDAWTASGTAVDVECIAGETFWSIQETALIPALIEATTRAMTREAA